MSASLGKSSSHWWYTCTMSSGRPSWSSNFSTLSTMPACVGRSGLTQAPTQVPSVGGVGPRSGGADGALAVGTLTTGPG